MTSGVRSVLFRSTPRAFRAADRARRHGMAQDYVVGLTSDNADADGRTIFGDVGLDRLEAAGLSWRTMPPVDGHAATPAHLDGLDAVLSFGHWAWPRELLAASPRLKHPARFRAGLDGPDPPPPGTPRRPPPSTDSTPPSPSATGPGPASSPPQAPASSTSPVSAPASTASTPRRSPPRASCSRRPPPRRRSPSQPPP